MYSNTLDALYISRIPKWYLTNTVLDPKRILLLQMTLQDYIEYSRLTYNPSSECLVSYKHEQECFLLFLTHRIRENVIIKIPMIMW